MMKCPQCSGKSRVYRSETVGDTVERYRRCVMCDYRWKNYEVFAGVSVKTRKKINTNNFAMKFPP